jgi:membrane protease subunit HflK
MNQEFPFDFSKINLPRFPKKTIQWVVVGIFCLILAFSSFFTVNPEEVGIILRFGKYTRAVSPGLNFKLPLGIESVTKVPVERQLKQEFGFRTQEAGVRSTYGRRDYQQESLMLTGDLNAAEVEWIVQFRIADPYRFLFKVRNAVTTFRDMNEAPMREVVGDRSVNEVLTVGRVEIANTVTERLQDLCNQYEMGIKVDQVVLQDVNPPDSVKPAFNEVNEAQQEREKLINQARSEYNKVIPKARRRRPVDRRSPGLRRGAGEPGPRGGGQVQRRLQRVCQSPGGDPATDLPGDSERGPPPGGPEADHR